MQVQPGGDLSQNLAQAGLVGWRQVILRPGMPVVRKCDDLRMMVTYLRVLAQAPFQRCKVVVDSHAATNSLCMNWRTGNDVR